jgi:hypothetical protein
MNLDKLGGGLSREKALSKTIRSCFYIFPIEMDPLCDLKLRINTARFRGDRLPEWLQEMDRIVNISRVVLRQTRPHSRK